MSLALGVGRAILMGRGARAVRRFVWAADGAWHLESLEGTRQAGCLIDATVALGPWILLVWTVDSGRGLGRRRYALIDEAEAGPVPFRALRGRLALTAGLRPGQFAPQRPASA
jgi:hypothetical protein